MFAARPCRGVLVALESEEEGEEADAEAGCVLVVECEFGVDAVEDGLFVWVPGADVGGGVSGRGEGLWQRVGWEESDEETEQVDRGFLRVFWCLAEVGRDLLESRVLSRCP